MQKNSEICIVGAGLVGMSLACALAPYFKITLFEKNLPNYLTSTTADDRPISLAFGSQQILQTLKIWPELVSYACAINAVDVTERHVFGGVVFQANDYNQPALGYVVPFSELQRVLYKHVTQQENINIVCGKSISEILQHPGDLIIACDGSGSDIRQQLKIPVREVDQGDVADIFKLNLSMPHNNTAFERFTEQGAVALLPMPDRNAMQCVWTHSAKHVIDENNLPAIFRGKIPEIKSIEKRARYTLKTSFVTEPIHERMILMGNAAHTIYPLAAQGFNLGLRDAAALSEVLVEAQLAQQEVGSREVLEKYLAWRMPDQKRIMQLTTSLVQVFGLQLPLSKKMRGLAMLACDLLPPLKKRLAHHTMGLTGRTPRLMRGLELVDL